jgi:tetratricopeptide (TPR) repeat protein
MIKNLTRALAAAVCCAALFAQAKQPQPKSQKELDALMAVQNAADIDGQIAAIEKVLTGFADTEFKPGLLIMAAALYQQKGDADNMLIYAERALDVDPKSYQAMLLLGSGYATRTREHDLDKEDKLAKAEGYANKALEALKTAEKPRPDLTDEDWVQGKRQLVAQAHEILGTAAVVRKKYDVAIAEYKLAMEGDPTPDATTMVRLAAAYNQAGKPEEALGVIEKVMAMDNVNPQVRSVAQAERVRAVQMRNAKSPAAAPKPEAGPTPEPVKP